MPIHARRLDQAHDRRSSCAIALSPSEEPVRKFRRSNPQLRLHTAVHVYTGWHPEVQYIGVYGGPHKIWRPVVAHFAQHASHPLFESCQEALFSIVHSAGGIEGIFGGHFCFCTPEMPR
ncbi:hypothetical protein D3C81_1818420 [compost metagenome]